MATSVSINAAVDGPAKSSSNRGLGWCVLSIAPLAILVVWLPLAERSLNNSGSTSIGLERFATWCPAILIMLLAVVTVTDLRWRRIPNWATYPTFLWGLGVNGLASWCAPERPVEWMGAVGLADSAAGGFGLLALMFFIFSLTGGGAGDVKLAACIGALLGFQTGFNAVLYSFIVGGVGTLMIVIMRCGPLTFVTETFKTAALVLGLNVPAPSGEVRKVLKRKVPLAPFFAGGVLIALFQEPLRTLLG